MKKRIIGVLLSGVIAGMLLSGCSQNNLAALEDVASALEQAGVVYESDTVVEEEVPPVEEVSDEEKAAEVAALIDAIYVQTRTEETDAQCIAAKEAWDALTDEQKEMVEGEEADPDYFGRDTGDASLDDPRNEDIDGENEILVVSFGTSFNGSRVADIKAIEDKIADSYPDWEVRRAFTAQIIINHVQARDGECIDNMDQALERAVNSGVKKLIVQPTHLMHGAEYDELVESLNNYADKFEKIAIAEPMLGQVGASADDINTDKETVAKAITDKAVEVAGYDSIEAANEDGTAFVFMGHGTSHTAKITYSQMQTQMQQLGYDNVYIGTVEGEPEETACEEVIDRVAEAGYTKVVLRPLMVVAGDHANNDMAGDDEDSWKSMFIASEKFETVDCQIEGLGSIEAVRDIYVQHIADVIASDDSLVASSDNSESALLEDGEYVAIFDTDSSMFHVNEVYNGEGTLTVENGEMYIHVVLAGDGILNLYPGLAEDAAKDGAVLLEPTKEEVEYADGTKEVVNAFDIPVPSLDEEFDCALIGKKGKWYDHKVSVKKK